jgi:hypothetical protein
MQLIYSSDLEADLFKTYFKNFLNWSFGLLKRYFFRGYVYLLTDTLLKYVCN